MMDEGALVGGNETILIVDDHETIWDFLIDVLQKLGYCVLLAENGLDAVEIYSNLSRAICNRRPDPEELPQWLEYVRKMERSYTLPTQAIGYFLSAFGFCITFGGTFADALGSGISGLTLGSPPPPPSCLYPQPMGSACGCSDPETRAPPMHES